MRHLALFAAAGLAGGCHSLLGIEDTTVGEPNEEVVPVGLDRVLVAEVRAPQLGLTNSVGDAATGALVEVSFLAEPLSSERVVHDDRDDAGLGCVVLTRDVGEPPLVENQGTIDVSGAVVDVPPCRVGAGGRYVCADSRTSSPDPVQITDLADGIANTSIPAADPPFTADDVGRHLLLPGEVPQVIDEVIDGDNIALFDPFATSRTVATAQHEVAIGLGPTRRSTVFLDGSLTLSIAKSNGASIGALSLATLPGGAGYTLDAASARPESLPVDGSAARLSCTGIDGNCGLDATHTAVWARTTDDRGPALLRSTELTPIAGVERELHCLFDTEDAEISAGAMAALLADGATRRIAAAVVRVAIEQTEDERPVALLVGFGHYGYTTISAPDDSCHAVFQDCSPGARCTAVSRGGGMETENRCVADGLVPRGGTCEALDKMVAGSTDNCSGGTGCLFDTCRDACDPDEVPCDGNQLCSRVADIEHGFCMSRCDPLDQTTCTGDDVCYALFGQGGACIKPTDPSGNDGPPKAIGEACTGFLNECEAGSQCIAEQGGGGGTFVCAPYCNTSNNCIDGSGEQPICGCDVCGADQVCAPFNDAANPDLGVCVNAVDVGCDCSATPVCPPP